MVTGPSGVSRVSKEIWRTVLSRGKDLIPSVVVWRKIRSRNFASSAGAHRSDRQVAGRLFFITMGVRCTSMAPCSMRNSSAAPRCSAVMSSMLHCKSLAGALWPAASSRDRARCTRRTLGMSRSRCPTPTPVCSVAMAGAAVKRSARTDRMAAPVGVAVSAWTAPRVVGTPCKSSTVAGAGTGKRPWAQRTKPPPSSTGEAQTASTSRAWRQMAAPTMSTRASVAPTSWK